MKLKFHTLPDHVKGAPVGVELVTKNIHSARLRDIAELQTQTGLKLEELRDKIRAEDILGMASLLFLTLRNAGAETFTWNDALDTEMDNFTLVQEPGDVRRAKEAAASPGEAKGDPADSAAVAAKPKPAARTRSSTPSRGSKTKSAAD
ncbi:hypothetical protein ACYX8G_19680 [Microbacterium saperdae]